jgi:hypothetical protein
MGQNIHDYLLSVLRLPIIKTYYFDGHESHEANPKSFPETGKAHGQRPDSRHPRGRATIVVRCRSSLLAISAEMRPGQSAERPLYDRDSAVSSDRCSSYISLSTSAKLAIWIAFSIEGYGAGQRMMGTVLMLFFGLPSMTRSL